MAQSPYGKIGEGVVDWDGINEEEKESSGSDTSSEEEKVNTTVVAEKFSNHARFTIEPTLA